MPALGWFYALRSSCGPCEGSPIYLGIWVVVKIMVPFWVLSIIPHLLFRDPKRTMILTTTHIPAALDSGLLRTPPRPLMKIGRQRRLPRRRRRTPWRRIPCPTAATAGTSCRLLGGVVGCTVFVPWALFPSLGLLWSRRYDSLLMFTRAWPLMHARSCNLSLLGNAGTGAARSRRVRRGASQRLGLYLRAKAWGLAGCCLWSM